VNALFVILSDFRKIADMRGYHKNFKVSKVLICWINLHILQGFKGADTYSRKPKFFVKILCYDIKKEKRQSQFCSASKSEAPLNAVIFTVAAYPN
jgi:hypothetical protein